MRVSEPVFACIFLNCQIFRYNMAKKWASRKLYFKNTILQPYCVVSIILLYSVPSITFCSLQKPVRLQSQFDLSPQFIPFIGKAMLVFFINSDRKLHFIMSFNCFIFNRIVHYLCSHCRSNISF